eukprot:3546025-Prymnesium_polylepis.2
MAASAPSEAPVSEPADGSAEKSLIGKRRPASFRTEAPDTTPNLPLSSDLVRPCRLTTLPVCRKRWSIIQYMHVCRSSSDAQLASSCCIASRFLRFNSALPVAFKAWSPNAKLFRATAAIALKSSSSSGALCHRHSLPAGPAKMSSIHPSASGTSSFPEPQPTTSSATISEGASV